MAFEVSSHTLGNAKVSYNRPRQTVWAKRGATAAFCLSVVPVGWLAWTWWVPPVTGDDIMAAGYGFVVLAMPASVILPGDFTSRGYAAQAIALGMLSIQLVIAGALIGWLLCFVSQALRASSRKAI
jgi:hypothetical protein